MKSSISFCKRFFFWSIYMHAILLVIVISQSLHLIAVPNHSQLQCAELSPCEFSSRSLCAFLALRAQTPWIPHDFEAKLIKNALNPYILWAAASESQTLNSKIFQLFPFRAPSTKAFFATALDKYLHSLVSENLSICFNYKTAIRPSEIQTTLQLTLKINLLRKLCPFAFAIHSHSSLSLADASFEFWKLIFLPSSEFVSMLRQETFPVRNHIAKYFSFFVFYFQFFFFGKAY